MISDEAVLCYVRGDQAWFTTCALKDQWGDDWDDAPYEHNASPPYPWCEDRKVRPYEVDFVFYTGDLRSPADGHLNSMWSVQQINAGVVAWLSTPSYAKDIVVIPAGTTYKEFRRLVRLAGGDIYEKSDR